jgi:HNH endonuclease
MKIETLSDKKLLEESLLAAERVRGPDTELLRYINEVERRKLFCDLGFSSMTDFIEKYLGFSDGSAWLRLNAARMIQSFPEIEEKFEQGMFNFSTLNQVGSFCPQNEITNPEDKKAIIDSIADLTMKEAAEKLGDIAAEKGLKPPGPKKSREGSRKTGDQYKLTHYVSKETKDAFEEIKDLLGAKDSDKLILELVRALKEKIDRNKGKQKERPRADKIAKATSRKFSDADIRFIWKRDKNQCVICKSKKNLQFDHIQPWAKQGRSVRENGRLLCGNCNQRERIKAGLPGKPAGDKSRRNAPF